MCTLSWLPGAHGYLLLFSRDERRVRDAALPPVRHSITGVRALAPIDPVAGGTWIGVNEFGVTAALLNRYDDAPTDPTAGTISRGNLVRSALAAKSARALIDAIHRRPLEPFQPFTVAAFDRRRAGWLADWNGQKLSEAESPAPGLVRTSSGKDQGEAERLRAAVFAAMIADVPLSEETLIRFHRGHQPERGPFSVCMHRDEAATRSLTLVRVSRRRAAMWYWHAAPCLAPLVTKRRLSLVGPRR